MSGPAAPRHALAAALAHDFQDRALLLQALTHRSYANEHPPGDHNEALAFLGDRAYNILLVVNHWYNLTRHWLGYPYWSLSAHLKQKVKNAVEYIGNFEHAVAEEARKRGVDGVICGHIHKAEIRQIGPVLYCNDGDWVESCTALVEHRDGRLEIIDWPVVRKLSMLQVHQNLVPAE